MEKCLSDSEIPTSRMSAHALGIIAISKMINEYDSTATMFVAGGAAKDVVYELTSGKETDIQMRAKDIDLYLFKKESFDQARKYLSSRMIEKGERVLSVNFEHKVILPGAHCEQTYNVQLIRPLENDNRMKFHGSIQDICGSFDIWACACAIYYGLVVQSGIQRGMNLVYWATEHAVKNLNEKLITFQNVFHPFSMLIRTAKYIAKGFKIEATSFVRILNFWNSMSQEERVKTEKVLKDLQSSYITKDDYEIALMLLSGPAVALAKRAGEPDATD
jgi:hypothetical protein